MSKAGRPMIGTSPKKRILFSIDPDVLVKFQKEFKQHNMSKLIENYMKKLIEEGLDKT